MFYLYLLLALALLTGALFIAPLRSKVWVAFTAVTAAAAAVAAPSISVLAGAPAKTLARIEGPLFGCEQMAVVSKFGAVPLLQSIWGKYIMMRQYIIYA